MSIHYRIRFDERLRIIYARTEEAVVEETLVNVQFGRRESLRFFGLEDNLPTFNVFLAPSRAEYDRFVIHLTPTPTRKERVAQPQGPDLYLLSPLAYPRDADCFVYPPEGVYDKEEYRRIVFHETVHMLDESVSPKGAMEVRPLWWAEGLAVWVSGQHEEKELLRRLSEALKAPPLPDPERLEGGLAYVLGWTLVRYIEERCGRGKLRDIMLNTSDPDILGLAGLASSAEIAKWKAWVPQILRENGGTWSSRRGWVGNPPDLVQPEGKQP